MRRNLSEGISWQKASFIQQNLLLCLLIGLLIISIYSPVMGFKFVNFDDPVYVYENPHVIQGLSWKGVVWAFSISEETYWHPMVWISHMMDCELFGVDAGKHHLVNVAFHFINSLLVYLMFWRLTKQRWQSFFIAALFAVHPICVDTVAWVAERKNLISTTFFILTIIAYIQYQTKGRLSQYFIALIFFIFGLLSKPTLVTLPGVLMLLDYWPLGRFIFYDDNGVRLTTEKFVRQNRAIFFDKLPFCVLTIIYVFIFMTSIRNMGAMVGQSAISLNERLANALISYINYIADVFWPQNLAVYYPFPEKIPLLMVVGALFAISGITLWAFVRKRNEPWFIFGWLWFCGTLIPVSGGIQAGLWPARADRWLYFPVIGLLVCIVFGWELLSKKFQWGKTMTGFLSVIVLLSLSGAAHIQTWYWRDSESLFRRAVNVTENNFIAYDNLGLGLVAKGRIKEAHQYFLTALRINPNFANAHHNLGASYLLQKNTEKAYYHLTEAIRLKPGSARLHNTIGKLLYQKGQKESAIQHFRRAIRIDPDFEPAGENLKKALAN